MQAAGKVPVDLHGLGVDYLSLSAHKLGGPHGRRRAGRARRRAVRARSRGGGQERGRRAGTENLAGIAGFGAAADGARATGSTCRRLRDRLEAALLGVAPEARVFGAGAPRLAQHDLHLHAGRAAETQVMALDLAGVCVSAGAACSSGKVPLGRAGGDGRRAAEAETAIRISLRLEHRIRTISNV